VPRHLAATEAAAFAAAVPPPRPLLRRATPSREGTTPQGAGGPGAGGPGAGGPGTAGPDTAAEPQPLPPLDDLVAGINTAAFAPGAADEDQARRAGDQVVAYAGALRERRPWWRRAWWSVHPGPLRWHRAAGPLRWPRSARPLHWPRSARPLHWPRSARPLRGDAQPPEGATAARDDDSVVSGTP
jgi:hypothetical protein